MVLDPSSTTHNSSAGRDCARTLSTASRSVRPDSKQGINTATSVMVRSALTPTLQQIKRLAAGFGELPTHRVSGGRDLVLRSSQLGTQCFRFLTSQGQLNRCSQSVLQP